MCMQMRLSLMYPYLSGTFFAATSDTKFLIFLSHPHECWNSCVYHHAGLMGFWGLNPNLHVGTSTMELCPQSCGCLLK